MKKNPGRRERRHIHFSAKRAEGKRRAKAHDYYQSHYWLPKFVKQREKLDKQLENLEKKKAKRSYRKETQKA